MLSKRPAHYLWVVLIACIYEVFPLLCPMCGGQMRLIAFITQIEKILTPSGSTPSPRMLSYSLYRWENNISAAAVLGVVGGGGLGQMLAFHMGLFQMAETSTVLLAMLVLVALVDAMSYGVRNALSR